MHTWRISIPPHKLKEVIHKARVMDIGLALIALSAVVIFAERPGKPISLLGVGLLVAGALLMTNVISTEIAIFAGGTASLVTLGITKVHSKRAAKITKTTKNEGQGKSFVGMEAQVMQDFESGHGLIKVDGEIWSAKSRHGILYQKGANVKVTDIEGIFLEVE